VNSLICTGNTWRRLAIAVAVLGGCLAIAWTSLGHFYLPAIGPKQLDYNNLLVSGFRKGSLALDIEVPKALRDAKDPLAVFTKSPEIAPHDVSFFRGHYYTYYGAVPAVVLFWPFRVLSGHDLPLVLGSLAFGIGAFVLISWLWLRIVRDHFPMAGWTTRIAGLAALGLAGGQWVLARRVSIWEPSIEAGNFFLVAMLASGYLALRSRRPWAWLAVSGLALGLATGSRPTLAAAGIGLVPIVLGAGWRAADARSSTRVRTLIRAILAAGLPLGALVAGLLAYNWARFGNIFELGLNYQLSTWNGENKTAFSPSFIPFNFFLYFLSEPQWGRYFPFLHPIAYPGLPKGYYGYEYVYGAFVVCPVLWWAVAVPPLIRGTDIALRFFAAGVLGVAGATTLVILCFNTAAARYETDFMPWWVFFGILGWALLENRMRSSDRTRTRRLLDGGFLACAVFSCLLSLCASAELHGILEEENPVAYHSLSGIFDTPTAVLERMTGFKGGAIEMNLRFAQHPIESVEPLVVTGVEYQRDYAYVYYQSDHVVRFCYVHPGEPAVSSADVTIEPGRVYPIRIECGSLYPPEGDPVYDGWLPAEVNSLKHWVKIDFDGHTVLIDSRGSNEASPGTVQIGVDRGSGYVGRRFAGSISDIRRTGFSRPEGDLRSPGDFEIAVTLPRQPSGIIQPILSAGRSGLADLVGVRVVDPRHYVFSYESWGAGVWESPMFAVPADGKISFRVRLGPELGLDESSPLGILGRSVAFWGNGGAVWCHHTALPLDPHPPYRLMSNIPGSSVSAGIFQGRVVSIRRVPFKPAWSAGPFAALDMELGGRGLGCEPLVATGSAGRADTVGIDWLGSGRARLVYDHWGHGLRASEPLDWGSDDSKVVRIETPSFAKLDGPPGTEGEGRLRVQVDGAPVWDLNVPFYGSTSGEVSVGRNTCGSSATGAELQSAVLNLRQELQ
jgi:hypothetical protein